MRGIDVSNWQPADITGLIRDNGAEHVIVRLSTEDQRRRDIAVAQLKCAKAIGCTVGGYIWCGWEYEPVARVRYALSVLTLAGLSPSEVGVIWLDAEETASGNVTSWLQRAAQAVKEAGYRVGIYSGVWWLSPSLPNLSVFSDLPFWLAEYNNKPDLESVTLVRGITRDQLWGHQYAADTIDLNVFDARVA